MLNQSQLDILTEGALQLGIALSDSAINGFSLYIETLQRWSKIANLVSQPDPTTVIQKHLLDSLALSSLLPSNCQIADLGSGAGFPGLVVAIADPTRAVTLIEPRRKRANFLKDVIRSVGLKNAAVSEGRAEFLAKEHAFQDAFDCVITRATWDLRSFLSFAAPFLKDNGHALAMKGKKGKQELEDVDAKETVFFLQDQYVYKLPFGSERRCVYLFQKHCST
jgi:16S rRNA (guanine527-N7)-methyltransferase